MADSHFRKAGVASIFAAAILFSGVLPSWAQSNQSPNGVGNFGRVTDTLYRGAQPSNSGFTALHQMGVSIIVNFRDERDETAAEQREVESLGMKYVGIPWS